VPIRSGRWAAVALAGLVPLLSVSLYLGIGDPSAVAPVARPAASQAQGMPPMEDLVAKLAKRMESQPNNVEGWVMLGRSYLALERVDDAVRAIEKARALAPDEPEILLALAEAIARGQRSLSGRALELIRQALVLQPDHPNGNWMLGLAEFQQDHFAEAIGAWSRLEGTLDPGSEDAQTLQSYLQEARQRTGGGAPAPAPTAAAATATTAGNPVGIEVEVSLAPEIGRAHV
jgi:cytochrome c-type biogenesis protein CcmH